MQNQTNTLNGLNETDYKNKDEGYSLIRLAGITFTASTLDVKKGDDIEVVYKPMFKDKSGVVRNAIYGQVGEMYNNRDNSGTEAFGAFLRMIMALCFDLVAACVKGNATDARKVLERIVMSSTNKDAPVKFFINMRLASSAIVSLRINGKAVQVFKGAADIDEETASFAEDLGAKMTALLGKNEAPATSTSKRSTKADKPAATDSNTKPASSKNRNLAAAKA